MTTHIGSRLLQQHMETFLDQPDTWQNLFMDNAIWELAYAPSLGHPAKLAGKDAILKHAQWFRSSVANWQFTNIRLYPVASDDGASSDSSTAIAEMHGEGLITTTGREYKQDYLLILRGNADGKIEFMREYFDPVRAARAMDASLAL